jgi:hypothetical protein
MQKYKNHLLRILAKLLAPFGIRFHQEVHMVFIFDKSISLEQREKIIADIKGILREAGAEFPETPSPSL